jgi:putative restriction endonuclease
MKLYLAVTDNDMFRFLRRRPEADEVNLWQASGHRAFKALAPGEPFLFKLHSPQNFVVGGGFFAHSSVLPASLAWEAFGEKNGTATYEEMRSRIEKYRPGKLTLRDDPVIGCRILVQPFFFDEIDWIPVPKDFSLNIVQGKSYDTRKGEGRALWERVTALLRSLQPQVVVDPQAELFGAGALVRPRLGQGSFRVLITDRYERRCSVTGERALPVLDAVHIRPVAEGGQHRIDNGLLMRTDLHRLFDRGWVTVGPDYRFRVSEKLAQELGGGEAYLPLDGQEIWVPTVEEERPRREFLEWHGEAVFRA